MAFLFKFCSVSYLRQTFTLHHQLSLEKKTTVTKRKVRNQLWTEESQTW